MADGLASLCLANAAGVLTEGLANCSVGMRGQQKYRSDGENYQAN